MSFWNNLTGANWQDHATYNMFVDAMVERGWAGSLLSASSGANAQPASWATQIQQAIIHLCDGYVSFTDPSPDSKWLTTNNLAGQTAASYGSAFMYSWASMNTAQLGGLGFTRKRPLEFATLAATTYEVSGASFVNGDNARCLADGIVYTRTAGAWVNSGVPVSDIFTVDNPAGSTDDELNGIAQEGDIIGLWIYSELRDIINLLLHRAESFGGWVGYTNNSNVGTGPAPANSPTFDLAVAEADAETDYDGGGNLSNESSTSGAPNTNAQTFPDSGGSGVAATIARVAKKIQGSGYLTTVSKTVRYFCAATRDTNDEWGGNGDFTTEGEWDLISSSSETAATTSNQSASVGNMSVKPSWPAGAAGATRGYNVNDSTGPSGPYSTHSPVIIATYDFAYGPTT